MLRVTGIARRSTSAAELHVDDVPIVLESGTNREKDEDVRQDLGKREENNGGDEGVEAHRNARGTAAVR